MVDSVLGLVVVTNVSVSHVPSDVLPSSSPSITSSISDESVSVALVPSDGPNPSVSPSITSFVFGSGVSMSRVPSEIVP